MSIRKHYDEALAELNQALTEMGQAVTDAVENAMEALATTDAEAAAQIQAGDTVSVDFAAGTITDETQGRTWQAAPFPEFIDGIIKSGGLLNSLKARGVAK